MKVLHVNTFDIEGGAARAVFRLNKALNNLDVNSKMLVRSKVGDDTKVISIADTDTQKILTKIRSYYKVLILKLYKNRQKIPFSIARVGIDIYNNKHIETADILNLHWINSGYLSLKSQCR